MSSPDRPSVRHAARVLLRVRASQRRKEAAQDLESSKRRKVFISYSHHRSAVVKKLIEALEHKGMIITNNKENPNLANMMASVDEADLAIVVMCKESEKSAACATEADYISKIKKNTIIIEADEH